MIFDGKSDLVPAGDLQEGAEDLGAVELVVVGAALAEFLLQIGHEKRRPRARLPLSGKGQCRARYPPGTILSLTFLSCLSSSCPSFPFLCFPNSSYDEQLIPVLKDGIQAVWHS